MSTDHIRTDHTDEPDRLHLDAWDELTRVALLGTGRTTLSLPARKQYRSTQEELASGLHAVGAMDGEVEHRLLLSAAAIDHYKRVGVTSTQLTTAIIATATTRASNTTHTITNEVAASPAATQLLDLLLSQTLAVAGQQHDLIALWAERCVAMGFVLATRQLLGALQHATSHKNMHPNLKSAVARASGTRGLLLAELNPEWAWVASAAKELNSETVDGSITSEVFELTDSQLRSELFTEWRKRNPTAAREAMMPGWSSNRADERNGFVSALSIGLTMDDEPFLDHCLDDKSKGVRSAAAELLSRLPASRLSQRMAARAEALMRVERSGILRRTTIDIEMPEEHVVDDSWKRDGIDVAQLPTGTGRRAWLLTRLVESTPLEVWEYRSGVLPVKLFELVESSPVAQELFAGWSIAANRQGNAEWADALCSRIGDPKTGNNWHPASALSTEAANTQVQRILTLPKPFNLGLPTLLTITAEKLSAQTLDLLVDWVGAGEPGQWVGIDSISLWFTNASAHQMSSLLARFPPDDARHQHIRHLEAARSLREAILQEFS